MSKILCIAQLETRVNLDKQISKQTIQPDRVIYYEDKKPAQGIEARRIRIAENHQKLREIVKAYPEYDLIWQLEQDGDLPSNCLEKLVRDLQKLENEHNKVGFISGIEVGRHGLYCLGAWTDITKTGFKSLDYKLDGLQEVDATGFYCLLANRDVWLKGKSSWNGQPYGPDVIYSLSLKEQGYKLFCDMDIQIGHIVPRGIIRPSHASTCNVEFYLDNTEWKYKQL